jgi:aminopeptidase-like protein
VDAELSREELLKHLHTDPSQPSAVPYVTSYYESNWGFCLSHHDLQQLGDGPFTVKVESRLFDGVLDYADLVIPGELEQEVLFSSYVCHPSMANNELSGPAVLTALARWILAKPRRRYTYRFFLGPETIGPLVYLSKNLVHLRNRVIAGWVLTCLGDERRFSYLESRWGTTLADRVTRAVMRDTHSNYRTYSFLERGSDERQWNAPGADLPVCSVMRSKYGTYPEYHTSLDNLNLVTPMGLEQSLDLVRNLVIALERNCLPQATNIGEPQLGRRGLQNNLSKVGSANSSLSYRNVLAYSDGSTDLISMSETIGLPLHELFQVIDVLTEHDLLNCKEILHP